jgi:hypothetical protein
MTYQPSGPKRPIQLLLSEDLVREVADKMGDVSEVVEQELCRLIDRGGNRHSTYDQAFYDEIVDMGIKFFARHGVWGEEFSTL